MRVKTSSSGLCEWIGTGVDVVPGLFIVECVKEMPLGLVEPILLGQAFNDLAGLMDDVVVTGLHTLALVDLVRGGVFWGLIHFIFYPLWGLQVQTFKTDPKEEVLFVFWVIQYRMVGCKE